MHELEMIHAHSDLTLAEVLSDPMIRSVMDADGVDPHALHTALGEIARTLKPHAASRQKLRSFWPSTLPRDSKGTGHARSPSPDHEGK